MGTQEVNVHTHAPQHRDSIWICIASYPGHGEANRQHTYCRRRKRGGAAPPTNLHQWVLETRCEIKLPVVIHSCMAQKRIESSSPGFAANSNCCTRYKLTLPGSWRMPRLHDTWKRGKTLSKPAPLIKSNFLRCCFKIPWLFDYQTSSLLSKHCTQGKVVIELATCMLHVV